MSNIEFDKPDEIPLIENRESECSACDNEKCTLTERRKCEHDELVQKEQKGGSEYGDIIYVTDEDSDSSDISDAGTIRYISDTDDDISIESLESEYESREPSYRGYSTESDSYGLIGSDTESDTDEEEIEELIHTLDDEDIKLSKKDNHSRSTTPTYNDLYEIYEESSESETDSEGERIKAILDELDLSEAEPDNYDNIVIEEPKPKEYRIYENDYDEDDDDKTIYESIEEDEDTFDDNLDDRIIEINIHNECSEKPEIINESDHRVEIKGGNDNLKQLRKFQYINSCC